MLFGLASIVLDTGLELSFWIIKSSVIMIYNGIYIWKYGTEETTQEQLNKLISVEMQNQNILRDTLNRLRIQEIEMARLKKKKKLQNNEIQEGCNIVRNYNVHLRDCHQDYDHQDYDHSDNDHDDIEKNLKLLDNFVIVDDDDYHL